MFNCIPKQSKQWRACCYNKFLNNFVFMLHVQKWTNRRTDSTTTIWVWLSCNFIVDLFEIICLIIQSERSRNESWLVFFLCASYQMSNWTIDYNKFAAKYATLKCKQTYETMTTDTLIDFTTCANVYRFIGSTSFLVANRHNSCTSRKHHHCQKNNVQRDISK